MGFTYLFHPQPFIRKTGFTLTETRLVLETRKGLSQSSHISQKASLFRQSLWFGPRGLRTAAQGGVWPSLSP